MSRRHDSLIPLSHQHQHALALAVIIKRRIGVEKGEEQWREEMAENIQQLYSVEIAGHFEVEETILFSQMENYLGHLDLVTELRQEDQALRDLIRLVGVSHPCHFRPWTSFRPQSNATSAKKSASFLLSSKNGCPRKKLKKWVWKLR